jgi:hypothetical protein
MDLPALPLSWLQFAFTVFRAKEKMIDVPPLLRPNWGFPLEAIRT